MARGYECGVSLAVALEGLAGDVVHVAVHLHDEPLLRPQEVDLYARHDHVRLGCGELGLADQG
jgi:hypothetical protein